MVIVIIQSSENPGLYIYIARESKGKTQTTREGFVVIVIIQSSENPGLYIYIARESKGKTQRSDTYVVLLCGSSV